MHNTDPQEKEEAKLLDVTQCLPSLSLTPLCTTHIQQEFWTYKKDKALSMTPTEAINTPYHDDLDVHHTDDCKFYTCNKRGGTGLKLLLALLMLLVHPVKCAPTI
jgi:hypothetical protein